MDQHTTTTMMTIKILDWTTLNNHSGDQQWSSIYNSLWFKLRKSVYCWLTLTSSRGLGNEQLLYQVTTSLDNCLLSEWESSSRLYASQVSAQHPCNHSTAFQKTSPALPQHARYWEMTKSTRCLPGCRFPPGWVLSEARNYWNCCTGLFSYAINSKKKKRHSCFSEPGTLSGMIYEMGLWVEEVAAFPAVSPVPWDIAQNKLGGSLHSWFWLADRCCELLLLGLPKSPPEGDRI